MRPRPFFSEKNLQLFSETGWLDLKMVLNCKISSFLNKNLELWLRGGGHFPLPHHLQRVQAKLSLSVFRQQIGPHRFQRN